MTIDRLSLALIVAVFALVSGMPALAWADERQPPLGVAAVGDAELVLSRPSAVPGHIEGLVIDSQALVTSLKARVLEARGLGEVAELTKSAPSRRSYIGSSPSAPEPAYVFAHRFAWPFDSVDASLRLRPLAEPNEGSFMFSVTLVFGTCIVFGLYALYRVAAKQIEFAERRNDFVSAVSHELKTPLTAIRMYAEMLEADLVENDARRRDYYRTITSESERLSRLINNVLELSSIEKRAKQLAVQLGDVRTNVRDALDLLRPHVERESFSLHFHAATDLPSAYFEPDALKQVLFNVVDNALKYSREAPERRIIVRLERGKNGYVMLAVRDHGPGVRREHLKSIFRPFFRGERELTRKNRGTGIGLSLVRGLVERMGGRVRGVNTQPGFEVVVELAAG